MENSPNEAPGKRTRMQRMKRIVQIIYLGFISSVLFIAAALAL